MSLPFLMAGDFYMQMSRDVESGFTLRKLEGACADIDAGTFDIWNYGAGANRTLATAADNLHVSSSSASDITSFVTVTGLDANYNEIVETIGISAGKTQVEGSLQFLRVNVVTLGSAPSPIVPPATATTLYVSSTSAGDTTQIVTITGTDANDAELVEQIALTGQTRAAGTSLFKTVTSAIASAACAGKVYVFYSCAVTSGVPNTPADIQAVISTAALDATVGDIYVIYGADVTDGVPNDATDVQAKIDATARQAYSALYTVPNNKNLYLVGVDFKSDNATTAVATVISAKRTIYGGSSETVQTIKYSDLGTGKFTDGHIRTKDQPILFPAKSEVKFTATLAGTGENLNISVSAKFVEESIDAVPNTVTVYTKTAYLAAYSAPIASQNYWLIGLDELSGPNEFPTTVNIDDVLTTITGATNYTVAVDTEVAFDAAYFTSGKLVQTDKKAVLTLMRCVDNGASVFFVLAPVNTIINLKNTKKVNFLHN